MFSSIARACACSAQRQHQSNDHAGQRKDGPASPAEGLAAHADFAVGEAEEPGQNQGRKNNPHSMGSAIKTKLPRTSAD